MPAALGGPVDVKARPFVVMERAAHFALARRRDAQKPLNVRRAARSASNGSSCWRRETPLRHLRSTSSTSTCRSPPTTSSASNRTARRWSRGRLAGAAATCGSTCRAGGGCVRRRSSSDPRPARWRGEGWRAPPPAVGRDYAAANRRARSARSPTHHHRGPWHELPGRIGQRMHRRTRPRASIPR